jgi:hypothetical protein
MLMAAGWRQNEIFCLSLVLGTLRVFVFKILSRNRRVPGEWLRTGEGVEKVMVKAFFGARARQKNNPKSQSLHMYSLVFHG